MNTDLVEKIYYRRKERIDHPDGHFDGGGRWYPSEEERCECCDSIRGPSRRWPWSYMQHCRTKKHIKNLVAKLEGQPVAEQQEKMDFFEYLQDVKVDISEDNKDAIKKKAKRIIKV